MSKELTDKQKAMLASIINSIKNNGYQPSYDELAYEFSITKKAVSDMLRAIEKKGYIEIPERRGRSIKIVSVEI